MPDSEVNLKDRANKFYKNFSKYFVEWLNNNQHLINDDQKGFNPMPYYNHKLINSKNFPKPVELNSNKININANKRK